MKSVLAVGRALPMVWLMLVAGGGCGEGTPALPQQLGDTTLVSSSSPLRGAASLREVSRIGMIDGPQEYLLGVVPMFTVRADGSLFVADDGDLRHYDAEGTFIRTIARQGEGPGEVRYVVGMDVSADGLLATLDFGNRRVSVFSRDGNLVREIRMPPRGFGRPGYGRDAIRWDDQGQLWIALNPPRSGLNTLRAGQQRPLFGRLAGHEEVRDTVFLPTRAWEGCERRLPAYSGGTFEDNRLRHMPFAQWSRSRTGTLAFGCSASYTMDLARPDGRVMRISRDWEPPVRTDDEHEYWSEGFRMANMRRHSDNQRLASLGREAESRPIPPIPDLPRERPAFLRIWLTDDGRVWSWRGAAGWSRPQTEEELRLQFNRRRPIWQYWNATDGFDVFDTDGRWLGHVSTPDNWAADPYPGNSDPYFRGDTIWAVVKDELEVRYIVRFEVEWPSAD